MTKINDRIEKQMKEIEQFKEAANETQNLSDLLKEKELKYEKLNEEYVAMGEKLGDANFQVEQLTDSCNELKVENEKTKDICDKKDTALKQLEEIRSSLEYEIQELNESVSKLKRKVTIK